METLVRRWSAIVGAAVEHDGLYVPSHRFKLAEAARILGICGPSSRGIGGVETNRASAPKENVGFFLFRKHYGLV